MTKKLTVDDLSTDEFSILELFKFGDYKTMKDICKAMDKSERDVSRSITRLCKFGLLCRKNTKNGMAYCTEETYRSY